METQMDQSIILTELLRYRDSLFGFICALTRDHLAAEEIFQEASLAIIKESQTEKSVGNFPAWAREIARRRVADYYRKQARRGRVEPLSAAMTEIIEQAFRENEDTSDEYQLRMKYLLECLELLTGRARDVVVRFYQQRQNLKQVAEALNWRVDSVKVALSRARKALADCIDLKLRAAQEGA
jgi:RNA polymerase sigma-70 factor, ECF subfamily